MNKSFTLIELIVVIAIIAILAAIVAPNAYRAIEKSRIAKTQEDLRTLKTAIANLYADTGRAANGCPAFVAANPEVYLNGAQAGILTRPTVGVVEAPCEWTQGAVNAWDGPYVDSANVTDFWNTSYRYDPDYAFCPAAACAANSIVRTECATTTIGAPPMLLSIGADKTEYTCDDIVVLMALN